MTLLCSFKNHYAFLLYPNKWSPYTKTIMNFQRNNWESQWKRDKEENGTYYYYGRLFYTKIINTRRSCFVEQTLDIYSNNFLVYGKHCIVVRYKEIDNEYMPLRCGAGEGRRQSVRKTKSMKMCWKQCMNEKFIGLITLSFFCFIFDMVDNQLLFSTIRTK